MITVITNIFSFEIGGYKIFMKIKFGSMQVVVSFRGICTLCVYEVEVFENCTIRVHVGITFSLILRNIIQL